MIKIRECSKKDMQRIQELGYELCLHIDKLQRIKSKKGRFYKRIKNLDIREKDLLAGLVGEAIFHKKTKYMKTKLEKAYSNQYKYLYLKKKPINQVVKKILDKGFLKEQEKYFILLIPKEELIPIRHKLLYDIIVKYLGKKGKIEKIKKAKAVYLLTEENKKVFGYLFGQYVKYYSGGVGEICQLVVSKKARGKGIGTKLIKKFLDICDREDISMVKLVTPKENKETIKFYKKCGFKIDKDHFHLSRSIYDL